MTASPAAHRPRCDRCGSEGARLRFDVDGDSRPMALCTRCARAFRRYAAKWLRREESKRDRALWLADAPELTAEDRAQIAAAFDPTQGALPIEAERFAPLQLEIEFARRAARFLFRALYRDPLS